MQKNPLTRWILTFVVMAAFVGCIEKKVVFDQFVGRTETQVRAKFGQPTRERVGSSAELLKGELAHAVRKHVPEGAFVKELYFESRSGERIFWLLSSSNVWTVVADVDTPRGVTF